MKFNHRTKTKHNWEPQAAWSDKKVNIFLLTDPSQKLKKNIERFTINRIIDHIQPLEVGMTLIYLYMYFLECEQALC